MDISYQSIAPRPAPSGENQRRGIFALSESLKCEGFGMKSAEDGEGM
jgi:hypothetical protein